jgi:hypothetical protein
LTAGASLRGAARLSSTAHANSICVFSGLNDFVNGPSPICGITDPTVANPGDFCGGFSNPDNPGTPPR